MATASRATTVEDAAIRVYETHSWRLYGSPLKGHSLSVTRMAFSPDEQFLLSVSRDRSWRIFSDSDGKFI